MSGQERVNGWEPNDLNSLVKKIPPEMFESFSGRFSEQQGTGRGGLAAIGQALETGDARRP
jgi:hypothetical protein